MCVRKPKFWTNPASLQGLAPWVGRDRVSPLGRGL